MHIGTVVVNHKCLNPGHFYHGPLLFKLDTQPQSHLVVEVCIQQGICTALQALQYGTPPPPGAMPCSLQE